MRLWRGIGEFSGAIVSVLMMFVVFAAETSADELKPRRRPDLERPLAAILCQESSKEPPAQALELWHHGIFDAGLEVYILQPRVKGRGDFAVRQYAEERAQAHHHLGFAFGRCSADRYWVVTVPAPQPFVNQGDVWFVQGNTLPSFCQEVYLDYADAKGKPPRSLFPGAKNSPSNKFTMLRVNTAFLQRGTLSLSCKPFQPKWLGKMMLYLVPIKQGPGQIPLLASRGEGPSVAKGLKDWINRIRVGHGYQPLKSHTILRQAGEVLVDSNPSIRHNRMQLRKASQIIRERHGHFLGENRVMAPSIEQAAWLLWNSPRHRGLLFHKAATHLEMVTTTQSQTPVAVIVFAKF